MSRDNARRVDTVIPAAQPTGPQDLSVTSDIDLAALPQLEEFEPDRTVSVSASVPQPLLREPYLLVVSGVAEGTLLRLSPGVIATVGRAEDCDLIAEDEGASRKHARIVVWEDSAVVEDLGSRNGTFVGSERVIERRPLGQGDLIRIGARTVIKFARMDAVEADFQRRLLQAALKDPLTGLYNRRHFTERLAAEYAGAKRHGRPLSLAMFDLDNFKKINDQYGHPAGDDVLRSVADTINRCARKEDTAFRYGGEEMSMLLRETDLQGAMDAAERIRRAVERSPVKTKSGAAVAVTVSIGVASSDDVPRDEVLVQHADAALYEAKKTGKNRVAAWRT